MIIYKLYTINFPVNRKIKWKRNPVHQHVLSETAPPLRGLKAKKISECWKGDSELAL